MRSVDAYDTAFGPELFSQLSLMFLETRNGFGIVLNTTFGPDSVKSIVWNCFTEAQFLNFEPSI